MNISDRRSFQWYVKHPSASWVGRQEVKKSIEWWMDATVSLKKKACFFNAHFRFPGDAAAKGDSACQPWLPMLLFTFKGVGELSERNRQTGILRQRWGLSWCTDADGQHLRGSCNKADLII